MHPSSRNPTVRLCGVAFAALAVVVCATGRASAACGDYVHVVKARAATDGPTPGEPDGPRPPCHAPGCSGKPATPDLPLTVPTAEPVGAKEVATRAAGDPHDHSGSSRHPVPESLGSPVRSPTVIFHPPRAG